MCTNDLAVASGERGRLQVCVFRLEVDEHKMVKKDFSLFILYSLIAFEFLHPVSAFV